MDITSTFQDYAREPHALSLEQMQQLHQEIIDEIGTDPDAMELYEELVDAADNYASIRSSWLRLTNDEKMEKDFSRTAAHNSVITHMNMLARYLKMQGKTAAWRDQLGDEEDDRYFRKTMGDFGCYIVFINSLCAR